ncbi:MAG: UDP-3-O-(3-hydroxymyristoyl)glucosamine N-acyltransferase [Candidatus Gastranaerophilales bacterium]|nr:UDP-3-O-(3-hydroxymyristoyl)glucosamine N-acyltransferase [Candidatus Gastranaerophilales bacterium]
MKEEKNYTLEQINEIVGGIINKVGSAPVIKKIAPPKLADENTLALALSEEEIENLYSSNAKAALVPIGVSFEGMSTIEVERPRLAMMKLIHLFYMPPDAPNGVHSSAVVHPDAKLGRNVSIGANVTISRGVEIGDNTKILPNVYIGRNTIIGKDCLFHAGVNIGDDVQIGNNVILQHGVSIGGDGFSFVTETPNNIETAKQEGSIQGDYNQQKIYKIPSIGSVIIEDDVEIGANATVDRGTIENTVIKKGTKIDNLVMVSHNCKVGENCMIVSQVGIAGSCQIGDRVVLAGQAGLADHINIGSDSIVMAQAGVTKSIGDRSIVVGSPAVPRKEFIKQIKYAKEVGELLKEFKKYKGKLEEYFGDIDGTEE